MSEDTDTKEKEEVARKILSFASPTLANPYSVEVLQKYGLPVPKNPQEVADAWQTSLVKLLVDSHTLQQLKEKLAVRQEQTKK